MSSKAQGSTARNVAIAVFVVVFLLLWLIGYGILAALVFALVLAAAAAAFLLSLGRRGVDPLDAMATGRVETSDVLPEPGPAAPPPPAARPAQQAAPEAEPVDGVAPEPAAEPVHGVVPESAAGDAQPAAAFVASPPGAVAPSSLDVPRAGVPDDLKRIRGVGLKLEEQLHRMGIFHMDQIAAWGPAEVAWMDAHLEGFRGRVTRDDWVGQARLLAVGGETEHSRRVDDGQSF